MWCRSMNDVGISSINEGETAPPPPPSDKYNIDRFARITNDVNDDEVETD